MNAIQSWRVGDVFLVPLIDGKWAVGQVVGREAIALNSASCAFFDAVVRRSNDDLPQDLFSMDNVYSVIFVTRELLDNGKWTIVGNRPVIVERAQLPFEQLRSVGFVGAKIVGGGIVNKFVNAFHGLHPWDSLHDPQYFDKLLVPWRSRPEHVVLSNRERTK
jgi:hypothetical protein